MVGHASLPGKLCICDCTRSSWNSAISVMQASCPWQVAQHMMCATAEVGKQVAESFITWGKRLYDIMLEYTVLCSVAKSNSVGFISFWTTSSCKQRQASRLKSLHVLLLLLSKCFAIGLCIQYESLHMRDAQPLSAIWNMIFKARHKLDLSDHLAVVGWPSLEVSGNQLHG